MPKCYCQKTRMKNQRSKFSVRILFDPSGPCIARVFEAPRISRCGFRSCRALRANIGISEIRGSPVCTPRYYSPYYGDIQKGTLFLETSRRATQVFFQNGDSAVCHVSKAFLLRVLTQPAMLPTINSQVTLCSDRPILILQFGVQRFRAKAIASSENSLAFSAAELMPNQLCNILDCEVRGFGSC